MNTPNNAAALERLENELREELRNSQYVVELSVEAVSRWADELATLRATLAQPDALTSQPSGLRESLLVLLEKASEDVDQAGGTTWVFDDEDMKKLRALATADAPGVAVGEVMIGRFKLACRALMGLRGQRSTVYAEDLETMVDVLRVLESVATLPVVNEAMVGRAYSGFANAKVADPTDTRARIRFALAAALAPKPEGDL